MTHLPAHPRYEAKTGVPHAEVIVHNLRGKPIADQVLELRLREHPMHAEAIDALEEHGIGREIVVVVDGEEYLYHCEVGPDDDLLVRPSDDWDGEVLRPDRFLETAFHARMRW